MFWRVENSGKRSYLWKDIALEAVTMAKLDFDHTYAEYTLKRPPSSFVFCLSNFSRRLDPLWRFLDPRLKYKFSVSYGSKVIAKVKVSSRQTNKHANRQTGRKRYARSFDPGHKNNISNDFCPTIYTHEQWKRNTKMYINISRIYWIYFHRGFLVILWIQKTDTKLTLLV